MHFKSSTFLFLWILSASFSVNADALIAGESPDEASIVIQDTNAAGTTITYLPEFSSNSLDSNAIDSIEPETGEPDLWRRIKTGYALPEFESPLTSNHETYFASKPDYVNRMMQRSQKYLYHIVEEVEKRGMPTEIALLPMVESGYNPNALSRSKASGLWQFMPATGKDFGLHQNWWVDNRRDVTAATKAALTYLQKLHNIFGSWDLALAAYNAGEGTVQRAIDKNRAVGLKTDYASLDLPEETKNYVPKLQAIKNIVTHPERFGLRISSIPNAPYFTNVKAPSQMDAQLAARLAEIPYEEFIALNPESNRAMVKASASSDKDILLPVSAKETFLANLNNYNKPLVSWQTYHAKRGERMDKIAKRFGINAQALRAANDLPATRRLGYAQSLIVPPSTVAYTPSADNSSNVSAVVQDDDTPPTKTSHIVRKNETLEDIAEKYDVSTKTLMKLNRLKSSKIKVGQKLKLSAQTSAKAGKKGKVGKQGKPSKHVSSGRKKSNHVAKRKRK